MQLHLIYQREKVMVKTNQDEIGSVNRECKCTSDLIGIMRRMENPEQFKITEDI